MDNKNLIKALKVAYLYMPCEKDITTGEFSENTVAISKEVDFVKDILVENGVDVDKLDQTGFELLE